MQSPNKFGFEVEGTATPQIINIPNPTFSGNPPNVPTFGPPLSQSTTNQSQLSSTRTKLKILNWSLLPLALMQLLFILPEAYPLLVTIVFPLLGLIGTMKRSSYFLKLFGIYLVLLVIAQAATMIVMRGEAYVVIQSLFYLLEIPCAYFSIKAGTEIDGMTDSEIESLKNS